MNSSSKNFNGTLYSIMHTMKSPQRNFSFVQHIEIFTTFNSCCRRK